MKRKGLDEVTDSRDKVSSDINQQLKKSMISAPSLWLTEARG